MCTPRMLGSPSTVYQRLAATGIRAAAKLGQDSTVCHAIISDNVDNRGLLIREFGVRVPGGEPVIMPLTSGFA